MASQPLALKVKRWEIEKRDADFLAGKVSMMKTLILAGAVVAVVVMASTDVAAKPKAQEVMLTILRARCGGKEVRTEAWARAHLRAAQKIYRPHGIILRAEFGTFSPSRCDLLTRQQRHSLAAFAGGPKATGKVVILVVDRIQDLDVPSYNLMGVHWRYRGSEARYRGRRWVYLTARARHPVLAHELGHYFGLGHDAAGGNLMTPGPSSPAWRKAIKPKPFQPIFSEWQARKVRRAVAALLATTSDGKRSPLK